MSDFLSVLGCVLIGLGVLFFAFAVLGLFRFKYVLNRAHAAAICDSFALGLVILGLICISGFSFTSLKLLSVVVLLFFASPVCAHLVVGYEVETNKHLDRECEVPEE